MGKPGVILTVARQYGANTLETAHAVEAALAELGPALSAQGVSVNPQLDRPATFTVATMSGLARDLAIGVALIAVALALFLREPRAVLNTMASIPLALLAAVMTLKAFGWTLNAMTLGGIILSLGIVFDDAVIGVDNVAERLREAEHSHGADLHTILAATLEVREPITYASLRHHRRAGAYAARAGRPAGRPAGAAGGRGDCRLAGLADRRHGGDAGALHAVPRPSGAAAGPGALTRLKDAHGRLLQRVCARPAPLLISVAIVGAFALAALAVLALYRSELLPPVHDGHLVAEVTAPAATALEVMSDMARA